MSRLFKFRVWNKEQNKMWSDEILKRNSVFALADGLESQNFLVIPFGEEHELMQYTGLKDDEGNEIYEGDILSEEGHMCGDNWVEDRLVEVIFESGGFLGKAIGGDGHTELDFTRFTVVGNKYEQLES